MLSKLILSTALLSFTASGFVMMPNQAVMARMMAQRFATPSSSSTSSTSLSKADLEGKEFQLEELEDKEESETELWLNSDGSVTLGQSNGPRVASCKGDWHLIETATQEDKPFRMRLVRTYEYGTHSGSNQVGEISYDVKREFWGNIEMVGDSISVSGTMHGLDDRDQIDCDLGFFTIIDAAASEGIEGVKSVAP
ncbi:predicted protein [Thalassiosira pseudonana CCMP1335]|uniref:Uncharacterized protein n=1 Tax=Thalassiosira pseudonana TaxID=35128 RepID=B8BY48_THAPS|nr:predicted protein [Thalassiosira pseudonana CCMP1335]EED93823.1 predicted protein [Thalassiosira pseudonana CCMP1335]|eukprot:g3072.t1 g3072   contig12:1359369-1360223(-)